MLSGPYDLHVGVLSLLYKRQNCCLNVPARQTATSSWEATIGAALLLPLSKSSLVLPHGYDTRDSIAPANHLKFQILQT